MPGKLQLVLAKDQWRVQSRRRASSPLSKVASRLKLSNKIIQKLCKKVQKLGKYLCKKRKNYAKIVQKSARKTKIMQNLGKKVQEVQRLCE